MQHSNRASGQLEDFCDDCFQTKLRVVNEKKFVYEKENIFVKVVGGSVFMSCIYPIYCGVVQSNELLGLPFAN